MSQTGDSAGDSLAGAPRLDFVDGVRAIAALAVVFIHAYYEPLADGFYPRWMYFLPVAYHRVPVDVFIVLSGFCLMLPFARHSSSPRSWKSWFTRRALRILPPFYVALCLSLVLTVIVINPEASRLGLILNDGFTFAAIPVYVLQLQDVFIGQFMETLNNSALWSIAVELKVYLFMPLILLSLRYLGGALTLLWTVIFGVAVQYIGGDTIGSVSPYYVALFSMGAISARAASTARVSDWWLRAAMICTFVFVALVVVKRSQFYYDQQPYFSLLAGAATALFLGAAMWAVISHKAGLVVRLLGSKPLAAIGAFSYSLYLIHYPLIRVLHLVLETLGHLTPETRFALLLAATPLYVGAAYLFHLAVEKPFMRSRRPGLAYVERLPSVVAAVPSLSFEIDRDTRA